MNMPDLERPDHLQWIREEYPQVHEGTKLFQVQPDCRSVDSTEVEPWTEHVYIHGRRLGLRSLLYRIIGDLLNRSPWYEKGMDSHIETSVIYRKRTIGMHDLHIIRFGATILCAWLAYDPLRDELHIAKWREVAE